MSDVEEVPSADLFKATASLILFTIALIGGILPQRLQSVSSSKLVSCLNTAAGGVFFASAMVHMLPESSATLDDAWGDVVPWGGFLCAFGFLLILCIDQAVCISHANANRGNGKARKNGHSLVPTTEPPDAEQHQQQASTAFARGRHRNTDSEDLAELEMSAISPRGLLSPTGRAGRGPPSEPMAGDGVDGGDSSGGSNGYRRPHYQGSGGGGGLEGGSPDRLLASSAHHDEDDDGDHHRHHDPHHHVDGLGGGDGAGGVRSGGGGGGGGGGKGRHQHFHSHSHGVGSEEDGVWVRLALVLALSVHSVMEGLGVGAKETKAYNLLFAIGIHKGLAAYALGASLIQTGVQGKQLMLFVLAFSAMTPIGILLGAIIEKDGEDDSAGAVCVALAAGTFLYVALMEVLPPELASTDHGWSKMGSLLGGFSVSAGVGWLVG